MIPGSLDAGVPLCNSEMNEIEAALPRDAAGGRYPEAMMAFVNL
jgi:hypothetical protein